MIDGTAPCSPTPAGAEPDPQGGRRASADAQRGGAERRPEPERERSASAEDRRGRVPLLRWAGIAYASLAAAALGWNRSVGHPWAYLDSAAAASGIRWGRDLALGLACAAAVIALSQRLTTRTRWGAALARELAEALGPLT